MESPSIPSNEWPGNAGLSEAGRVAQRVMESAPNGILLVNREGQITLANSMAVRMFGYEREELIGQPVEILVLEAARQGHRSLRSGFFANPSARPMAAGPDLVAVRKDG